jgi:hypothetical protein
MNETMRERAMRSLSEAVFSHGVCSDDLRSETLYSVSGDVWDRVLGIHWGLVDRESAATCNAANTTLGGSGRPSMAR